MAEPLDQALSLALMRGHPAQAARVLETLPDDDAAALFARAPSRLVAGVLAAMLPQRAARVVGGLDGARTLELLAPMATQPTVAILCHLPEPRRRRISAGLPTATALASNPAACWSARSAAMVWRGRCGAIRPPTLQPAIRRCRCSPRAATGACWQACSTPGWPCCRG